MPIPQILLVTLLILGYALFSRWLAARSISGPLAVMAVGIVLGLVGLWQDTGETSSKLIEICAEAALVMAVFSDANRVSFASLRSESALPRRLLTIGFPLTVLAGLGVAMVLFPQLRTIEALALAAVLAPTDATLCEPAISNRKVPVRIRQALNVESGLNDGLTAPIITLVLALAASEEGDLTDWASYAVGHIGFGLSMGLLSGVLGAWLLRWAVKHELIEGTFRQMAVMLVAVAAYASSEMLNGNGIVAAFVAGIAFGQLAPAMGESATDFVEEEGQLLVLLTFLFWAVVVVVPQMGELTWQVGLYVLLSLTLIRFIPVAIATLGLGLRPRTIAYLGWFGPRGLASIIFAYAVLEDLEEGPAALILLAATWTVAISTVAHSLTAVPWSERYGEWFKSHPQGDSLPEAKKVEEVRHRAR